MDEFIDIPGYPGYKANRMGEIKGKRDKLLNQYINANGYKRVSLYVDGSPKHRMVHRLVAFTFIPNPDNLPEIDHIDNNPANNHVDNLRWISKADNVNRRDHVKNGKCYYKNQKGWQVHYRMDAKIHTKYFKQEQYAINYVAQLKANHPHTNL